MSSISPPPPQPPSRPYSPYSSAASPTNPVPFAPPAKRQRLSPSIPNGLPSYGPPHNGPHGLSAVGAYGNPYAAPSPPTHSSFSPTPYSAASSAPSSFNTPQPYQPPRQQQQQHVAWQPLPTQAPSSQMMPPPPRPNKDDREDRAGVDEIGDSLFGSGINLKDEENYLHNTFHNRHGAIDSSFATNQSGSFGGSSTLSPNNSFNLLTQNTSFLSSTGPDGAFAGTVGAMQSQEQIDEDVKRRRQQAALERARHRQHHQTNPYLLGTPVYNRLHRRAHDNGVRVPTQGLYQQAGPPSLHEAPEAQAQVLLNGNKSQGLVRAQYLLDPNVELEQILTLVSLAAGERIRGLMDEALALSRARRYGDHGRVPPAFADIAVGEGGEQGREEAVMPQSITGSQWDGLKEHDAAAATTLQRTVAFPSRVSATLRDLAAHEKKAEKDRTAKREARRRAAAANGGDDLAATDPLGAGADLSGTARSGTPAEAIAPLAAAAAKLTKKEAERAKKEAAKSVEANSHTTTNQTAAMMALGKKGKRYDWMTGGAGSMPTNRFKAAGGSGASGTATPTGGKVEGGAAGGDSNGAAGTGAGTALSGGVQVQKAVEWGDWTEDGVGGTGIQLRDWAAVLERDGREKMALQRAWHRMG